MLRELTLASACLLIAGCDRTQPPSSTPDPAEPTATSSAPEQSDPTASPANAPTTLAGEWRVAGIDGAAFDEPYGLALSADDKEIWWSPRCAGQSIRYRIDGGRFEVVPPPPPPAPAPGAEPNPPVAVCAIGLPERLPEVMNAIRAADRIERTPQNGVRLSGKGRSVTLFSQ